MEENNFEKQIQERLADITITPSREVWSKVESRIDKRKDRKFLWFWLLIPVTIGAFFLFTTNFKFSNSLELSKNVNQFDLKKHSINPLTSKKNKIINDPASGFYKMDSLQFSNAPNTNDITSNDFTAKRFPKKPFKYSNKNTNKSAIKSATIGDLFDPSESSIKNEVEKTKSYFQPVYIIEPPCLTFSQMDSLKGNNGAITSQTENPKDSINKTVKVKGWKFVSQFSIGSSSISKVSQPALNDPATAQSNGNPYSQPPSSYIPPSKIKSGIAFSIGLNAEKKINSNTSFITGINFKHYSLSIGIGNRDSSLTYTVSPVTTKYVEHFNYIEIPLLIKTNLPAKNKSAIFLEGGLNLVHNLNSNALQYNSGNNTYYSGNALLNKNLIQIQAGISFEVKNRFFPISIGPSFSYDLSNFAQSGYYGRRHGVFSAIKTSIYFRN